MNVVMNSEQEVIQEGVLVLLDHLGASKTARFLSAWRQGAGNYGPYATHYLQAKPLKCLHCQGQMERGTAPFRVERKGYHVTWDALPAWVCTQCGEVYFEETDIETIQGVIRLIERKTRTLRQRRELQSARLKLSGTAGMWRSVVMDSCFGRCWKPKRSLNNKEFRFAS